MGVLVVKEMNGVLVQSKGERLEEGDVVGHHFLVRKVKLMDNYRVDVIVRQQVVNGSLVADILKEDIQRLQQLNAHVVISGLLIHYLQEVGQHVPFQKEVEDGAVVLVAPDEDLGDGTERLDEEALVAVRHHLVLRDDGVEILQVVEGVRVFRTPYAAEKTAVSEHSFEFYILVIPGIFFAVK